MCQVLMIQDQPEKVEEVLAFLGVNLLYHLQKLKMNNKTWDVTI
jgi:hypothetical protein